MILLMFAKDLVIASHFLYTRVSIKRVNIVVVDVSNILVVRLCVIDRIENK